MLAVPSQTVQKEISVKSTSTMIAALLTAFTAFGAQADEPTPFHLVCLTEQSASQQVVVQFRPGLTSVTAPGLLMSTVEVSAGQPGTTTAITINGEQGQIYVSNQHSYEAAEKMSLTMSRIEPENHVVTHWIAKLVTFGEAARELETELACTYQ